MRSSNHLKSKRRDRKIALMRQVDVRDASGSVEQDYELLADVWADVRYPSRTQKENIDGGRETSFQEVHFDIRYRSDVDKTVMVDYNEDRFDIITVKEVGRKDALVLVCTWRDNEAAGS